MFIAALFTITKIWKQLRCPTINKWIKKMLDHIYTCTYIYYLQSSGLLAMKKNEILLFVAAWMDLQGIVLSVISQRKTNTIRLHLYVEYKKQNKQTNKTKQTHRENKLVTSRGEGSQEKDKIDEGEKRYKLTT